MCAVTITGFDMTHLACVPQRHLPVNDALRCEFGGAGLATQSVAATQLSASALICRSPSQLAERTLADDVAVSVRVSLFNSLSMGGLTFSYQPHTIISAVSPFMVRPLAVRKLKCRARGS